MDTKVEMHDRVMATKELHSLSKTSVLLLRDLPFVANLSKFHDEDFLGLNYNDITQSKNEYSNRHNQQIVKDNTLVKDFNRPKNLNNGIDSNGVDGRITLVGESRVKVDKSSKNTRIWMTKSSRTCNAKCI